MVLPKKVLLIEMKLIWLMIDNFFPMIHISPFHISFFISHFIVGVGVNDEEELLITNTKSRRLLSGDISDGTMGGGGGEEEEKGELWLFDWLTLTISSFISYFSFCFVFLKAMRRRKIIIQPLNIQDLLTSFWVYLFLIWYLMRKKERWFDWERQINLLIIFKFKIESMNEIWLARVKARMYVVEL